jgi:hypothetical protein
MLYPYNAIFRQCLLNTFKAVLHSAYFSLKVPTTFGVITLFSSQKGARNIERDFTPGHKNMHFLRRIIATFVRWLKTKDLQRKKREPRMQGAQNKKPPMKKEATPKRKGLKTKDL